MFRNLWNRFYRFVNNIRLSAYANYRNQGLTQREAVEKVRWDAELMCNFAEKELEASLQSVGIFWMSSSGHISGSTDRPGQLLWLLGDLSPLLAPATRARLLAVVCELEAHSWGAVRRPANEARKKLEA